MTPSSLLSGHPVAGLRIGLLGGSFNPAHVGHLAMSLHALRRMQLDQIWWLVSPQNPLKSEKDMASLTTRLAKARAVVRHPKIRVMDLESKLGTRYTVDTLRHMKRRFPSAHFVWLMGADNMEQITRWKEWPEIFALVPVAVFRRPAYAAGRGLGKAAQRFSRSWMLSSHAKSLVRQPAPAWLVLDNPLNNTSATAIRHLLQTEGTTAWQKRKKL
jgi:nicotinate-nucleotide adenylyltransferase